MSLVAAFVINNLDKQISAIYYLINELNFGKSNVWFVTSIDKEDRKDWSRSLIQKELRVKLQGFQFGIYFSTLFWKPWVQSCVILKFQRFKFTTRFLGFIFFHYRLLFFTKVSIAYITRLDSLENHRLKVWDVRFLSILSMIFSCNANWRKFQMQLK